MTDFRKCYLVINTRLVLFTIPITKHCYKRKEFFKVEPVTIFRFTSPKVVGSFVGMRIVFFIGKKMHYHIEYFIPFAISDTGFV